MTTQEMLAKFIPCVRCGFCCKKCACGYGEWDAERHQCKSLAAIGDGTYNCALYDEIVKDPSSEISPAFGAGCCMALFNDDRDAILRRKSWYCHNCVVEVYAVRCPHCGKSKREAR
jgi:hypothetical protein